MVLKHDPVAQWIERWIADPKAAGSNPAGITQVGSHSGLVRALGKRVYRKVS